MARRNGAERMRREPVLDVAGAAGTDLRLSAHDRPGLAAARPTGAKTRQAESGPGGRREPTLEPAIPSGAPEASRDSGRASTPRPDLQGLGQNRSRGGPARPVTGEGAVGGSRNAAKGRRAGDGGKGGGSGGARGGRRRSFVGHVAYFACVIGLWCVIGVTGIVAWHFMQLPPIDQLTVPKRPPNIAILAADGTLIANKGDTGGRAVALNEVPPYLPKAFLAIEDRRFYSHQGIDPMGVVRAVVRNVTARGVAQGGSTLTQQLAKNLFLTQERTLSRKIQEAILAVWLERTYSKDRILELYLNRVYFGAGAYGVEAAAQRYFGKAARDVTLAEAAMLAGLVQAPSRLAPTRNPDAAQARAQLVLTAMAQEGYISDAKAKSALMTPAEAVKPRGAGSANYAADYVMDVLDDFVGKIDRDVVVSTTLDPVVQAAAETALVQELDRSGRKFGVSQGAVVTLAADGAVKALVGGRSYADSQFNRATTARRQPGSAFKPFVYLAALERGLTPDSVRDDGPVSVKGWTPENFSRSHSGPMTLTTALAHSVNTVAVKLCLEVGPKAVVRTAQRLGVTSAMQPNASIALGTSEVAPIELVAAYAALANGGSGVIPYVIRTVKTVAGKAVYARKATGLGPVIDPVYVGMMNAMLRETLATGTARKADLAGWDAAGKTGTSQDFRDAWFVGYTARLVTGVWLGNDDGSPTRRASGSNLPVEIWSRVMKSASRNLDPAPLPGAPWRRTPGGDLLQGLIAASDKPIREAGGAVPVMRGAAGQRGAPGVEALRPPAAVAADRGAPSPRERNFLERLFGG